MGFLKDRLRDVQNAVTNATSGVADTFGSIADVVVEAAQTAATAVSDVIDNAASAFSGAVEAVQSTASEAGDWLDSKVEDFKDSPIDAVVTMTPAYLVASILDPDISTTPVSDLIDTVTDVVQSPLDGIVAAKDWLTTNWPWLIGGAVLAIGVVIVLKGRLLRRVVLG